MRTARRGDHHGWEVQELHGSAHELHHLAVPEGRRGILVHHVERPALVLGSAQDERDVDEQRCRSAGIEVVRRRSGGGAVLLVPGEHVWVDAVLPWSDPLRVDDVGRSMWWYGEVWADSLGPAVRPADVAVHRGAMRGRAEAGVVCFAGLGPGEVTVGGRKLVGVSQRRSRRAARLQAVVHRRFVAAATLDLLRSERCSEALDAGLSGGTTSLSALGVDDGWDVVEHLLEHLPR